MNEKPPRLRLLQPMVKPARQTIADPPPKEADKYYHSPEWKQLRRACFVRDGWKCTAPGCSRPAVVADHIVSRTAGGSDDLSNLRSLCRDHDNRVKEDPSGQRRSGGSLSKPQPKKNG